MGHKIEKILNGKKSFMGEKIEETSSTVEEGGIRKHMEKACLL